ncbi:cytochrome b/b6 domain-containing protein [Kaistella jeonii]|uniref:Cytochrome B561 n=1 Tax=Kaistella jeonii TaxID=266749 RepID=A0A0C1CWC3_9FLAO|nr:cytochrome b/b6 domain-containing protein [Kaistella jeonii]KIA88691.1 cytochrome B561 [Kaistella jeonii]SFC10187.1 Ni,Fe-hydrogenase I cytochrome b subunit [Kaistella jeonii]VEI95265.1 Ni/Fe-hydrogenase, b-type cytochrome subunit [Kaistella jeonii]
MKTYTALHRLLHWTFALGMLVLFTTGFLRMYWMSKTVISEAVNKNLEIQNLNLDKQSLRTIVHSVQDPMFQWHVYAAYIITFAFIVRIIYMIVKGIKFPNLFLKTTTTKEKLQGLTYLGFYVLVAVQIITGSILKFEIGSESLGNLAETVHKLAIYWMPIFVLLHFAGVAISENTNRKGITSKMIGGDSK